MFGLMFGMTTAHRCQQRGARPVTLASRYRVNSISHWHTHSESANQLSQGQRTSLSYRIERGTDMGDRDQLATDPQLSLEQ